MNENTGAQQTPENMRVAIFSQILRLETFIVNITWHILNELCKFKLFTIVKRRMLHISVNFKVDYHAELML